MPIRFSLNRSNLADLAVVRDLGAERIASVADALDVAQKETLQPEQLEPVILTVVDDLQDARALLRSLFSWHSLQRQHRLSVDDIFAGLQSGVQQGKWSREEIDRWSAIEPALRRLLQNEQARTVAKVLDLRYEYQNLLQNAQILTDIRPVFNMDASDINGAIVTYILQIRFDSADNDHSLSIAMDHKDVEQLAQECARALAKADTAIRVMASSGAMPTLISGKDPT